MCAIDMNHTDAAHLQLHAQAHIYTHSDVCEGAMQEQGSDCLLVACLTSQQHASVLVSQGRIYSDNFMCCHTEIDVAV